MARRRGLDRCRGHGLTPSPPCGRYSPLREEQRPLPTSKCRQAPPVRHRVESRTRNKVGKDMGAILTLIVIVIVGAVAWWLLRKVIHLGFLIAVGLVVLFGWWWFFVR